MVWCGIYRVFPIIGALQRLCDLGSCDLITWRPLLSINIIVMRDPFGRTQCEALNVPKCGRPVNVVGHLRAGEVVLHRLLPSVGAGLDLLVGVAGVGVTEVVLLHLHEVHTGAEPAVLLTSPIFKESALGRFFHRVAMSVYTIFLRRAKSCLCNQIWFAMTEI